MKEIIKKALKIVAKAIIKKYKPEIIGITGSVGKTSTKEAIELVLKKKYKIRAANKNYNNEFGIPLTIIGSGVPGKSIKGWARVFFKAIKLLMIKEDEYPTILILEFGTDKRGDISYLTDIAPPTIGVVTYVGTAHIEFFKTKESIAKEKMSLIKDIGNDGVAILNGDNEYVVKEAKNFPKIKKIKYGFTPNVDVKAYGRRMLFEKNSKIRPLGLEFRIKYRNETYEAFLPGVLSDAHILSILPAIIIADTKGIQIEDAVKTLRSYHVPPGRMKILPGIKYTTIIDDTYNASPEATLNALDALFSFPIKEGASKWVVLGDMLELGALSIEEHKKIGKEVVRLKNDYLMVIGTHAKYIAESAKNRGMRRENIFHFDDIKNAGLFLQDRILKGDIILIKGSQGMRMEKIVKEIMADPLRAEELLVRQDNSWNK